MAFFWIVVSIISFSFNRRLCFPYLFFYGLSSFILWKYSWIFYYFFLIQFNLTVFKKVPSFCFALWSMLLYSTPVCLKTLLREYHLTFWTFSKISWTSIFEDISDLLITYDLAPIRWINSHHFAFQQTAFVLLWISSCKDMTQRNV